MNGLRTMVYFVPELEKARDWYANVFNAKAHYDTPYYVGFNIEGFELGLHPSKSGQVWGDGQAAYWGVKNIEESYARLIDLGATAHEKVQNVGGEIKIASVKDPWGNILGIIHNPEFKFEG